MPLHTPSTAEPDYRMLLQSVHAIVWRADARTFQTTFASREAEEILGYPSEAWVSTPGFWTDHIHPDDRAWVLALSGAETRAGRSHDYEYRMIAADGRIVWLRNIVTVVMKDGEPDELIGVTVNVTKRKQAEFEADQLRQELVRVARAFTVGEVAATLAHELNQPLGAIAANAETVQLMLRDRAPADRLNPIVEDIRSDAQRAAAIVSRVHALLERQIIDHVVVPIGPVVHAVLHTVRPLLTTRGIEWTVEVDPDLPPASGDPVQIQQVLLNLIRNAIEAMADRAPSERRLSLSARRRDADTLELSVADSGRGIKPEIMTRLFEPFATTKPNGIGMGLAISRRIVQAHGGEIHGESVPDGGATINFTLPVHGSARR